MGCQQPRPPLASPPGSGAHSQHRCFGGDGGKQLWIQPEEGAAVQLSSALHLCLSPPEETDYLSFPTNYNQRGLRGSDCWSVDFPPVVRTHRRSMMKSSGFESRKAGKQGTTSPSWVTSCS